MSVHSLRGDKLKVLVHRRWVKLAKCQDYETSWFFPASTDWHGRTSFCLDCPVKDYCLAYALAVPGTDGIWGGTSAHERNKLLRSHKADAMIVSAFGTSDHNEQETGNV